MGPAIPCMPCGPCAPSAPIGPCGPIGPGCLGFPVRLGDQQDQWDRRYRRSPARELDRFQERCLSSLAMQRRYCRRSETTQRNRQDNSRSQTIFRRQTARLARSHRRVLQYPVLQQFLAGQLVLVHPADQPIRPSHQDEQHGLFDRSLCCPEEHSLQPK